MPSILVVILEGDGVLQDLVLKEFHDSAYAVAAFEDNTDALNAIHSGQRFDVLLSDVRLLDSTSGHEVASAFQATFPSGTLIFLATPLLDEEEIWVAHRNAWVMMKPFTSIELVKAVQQIRGLPRRH